MLPAHERSFGNSILGDIKNCRSPIRSCFFQAGMLSIADPRGRLRALRVVGVDGTMPQFDTTEAACCSGDTRVDHNHHLTVVGVG